LLKHVKQAPAPRTACFLPIAAAYGSCLYIWNTAIVIWSGWNKIRLVAAVASRTQDKRPLSGFLDGVTLHPGDLVDDLFCGDGSG